MKEKLSLRWLTAGIEWEYTRAFLLSNANEGYIRINLKGREPQGVVEPGKEYEVLCEQLYQTAKGFTNPTNGKSAVRSVYKTDDIYRGPCRSHMPDVIINWDPVAEVTTELFTANYGTVRSEQPAFALAPYYVGNHRPNAFMVAVGPDVPQGKVLEGTSNLDLAPTLLSYFGVERPEYMDGRALSELCHHPKVKALSSSLNLE
jgi:predicted AlkP superfamily phosphohydrolase/phosphomutase